MIPRAKTLRRSKAPPENMSNMPKMVRCWRAKKDISASASTPGVGMKQPMR